METNMARFSVQNDEPYGSAIWIYDDDFGFDVTLKITGDWLEADKLRYAEAVCNVLNYHDTVIPTPVDGRAEVMTIHCWGCKKPALCIFWSKASGYHYPSCGICPVPDPTGGPSEMIWLGSPASGEANPPGCICRYKHKSDPMCTYTPDAGVRPNAK
jgi:hypothetical protein